MRRFPGCLRWRRQQPDQVAGGRRQGKSRIDAAVPLQFDLSQPGRSLDPTTFLLCAFATVLADLVAGAAGGASVDIYAARLALGDRAAGVSIDGDVRVTASDVGSDNAAFAISRMALNGWSNRTRTLRCSNRTVIQTARPIFASPTPGNSQDL